jgi:hypothetical protein
MYCKKVELLRIICEYKNDIETENINHDLWSWQIKSTNLTKLSKEEILKSLDLFYELNRNNNYSRFILVCNKDISSTSMERIIYYSVFEMDQKLQTLIQGKFIDKDFVSKIYFLKGPDTDSINSVIKDEMSCISNKDHFFKSLFSLIDEIWGGLNDITKKDLIDFSKSHEVNKSYKTIDIKKLDDYIIKDGDLSDFDKSSFECR